MLKPILFILLSTFTVADANLLQSNSIDIEIKTDDGKSKVMSVGRNLDRRCKEVPIANHSFWSEGYASKDVPDVCKSTFVTTSGQLSPMKIDDDVETFGELEVLEFIEEMQEDENMLLIDTRKPLWFEYRTIPSAVNIPFEYIIKPKHFKKEFKEAFQRLGVRGTKKAYDFSKAKTIVLFCNASWCGQSPAMINSLLSFGYPPQKIKWYRGGMASWLGLNMSSTRP
ncbi:MAG: rhodanese-like domain-containing protein [Epsilonproteobacteria bacterium]|nr:rhodanese-like domain-containing protein [Campylobacterota bacterium]